MAKTKSKLPKSLTTVTTFSKLLAAITFITFPLFAFYLGIKIGPYTNHNFLMKDLNSTDSTPKIVASHVTYDCQINIDLSNGQTIYINTGFYDLNSQSAEKCYQFLDNQPSPSGKLVAFRDISGGVDLKLSLFSIQDYQVYTLGNWGTSDLLDFEWTNDDQLVVLYGWLSEPESQSLSYFDLSNWDSLKFDEYNYLINNATNLKLPDFEKAFSINAVTDGKVFLKSGSELIEVELP